MKKKYDIVFFTNQPAFYKVKLYNKIAEKKKILVIFLGTIAEDRKRDFLCNKMEFEYIFLNSKKCEDRNIFYSLIKLLNLLKKIKYELIISMGWSYKEDFFIAIYSPKNKNGLVCESSIYESELDNWKKCLKKFICLRMAYAFVSGQPHKTIFEKLGFKGKVIITGGVGLIDRTNILKKEKCRKKSDNYSYICVARLIPEKNLEFLIKVFNKNKKKLAIVGSGILDKKLKTLANNNISFLGHVKNTEIWKLYQANDIFILPSKSEAWGLVVEEVYNGIPVLVSDKVGSNLDLVKKYNVGEIFIFNSEEDLNQKIQKIEIKYEHYQRNIEKIDFITRDLKQINSYCELS